MRQHGTFRVSENVSKDLAAVKAARETELQSKPFASDHGGRPAVDLLEHRDQPGEGFLKLLLFLGEAVEVEIETGLQRHARNQSTLYLDKDPFKNNIIAGEAAQSRLDRISLSRGRCEI